MKAFQNIFEKLNEAGHKPQMVRLDNEATQVLKAYFEKENLSYQLVPPNNHRRNYEEKAIGTFKDHFISGLCSLGPQFPLHLWCRLLPHAQDTLNLLRPSHIDPQKSAFEILRGKLHYNKTPILPPGMRILIHGKPHQRSSWAPRGLDGWYLGPSKKHYQCHRVFCSKTNSERITDTMAIFHKHNTPTVSIQEAAVIATENLKEIMKKTTNIGEAQLQALQDLAKNFQATSKISDTRSAPLLPQHQPITMPNRPNSSILPPTDNVQAPRVQQSHQNPVSQPRVQPRRNQVAQPIINAPIILPNTPQQITVHPPPFQNQQPHQHSYNLRKHRRPNPQNANPCLQIATPYECNAVYDTDAGKMLEFRHLVKKYPEIWIPSMANEFGRLMQGVGDRMKSGSNTMKFVAHNAIPKNKTVTYACIVCDYRPLKSEPNRTRLTVGGDRLTCSHATSTDAADLILIKLFFNSVLSTPQARFITTDIKDFFLANNPSLSPEFMRIRIEFVPPEIITQ